MKVNLVVNKSILIELHLEAYCFRSHFAEGTTLRCDAFNVPLSASQIKNDLLLLELNTSENELTAHFQLEISRKQNVNHYCINTNESKIYLNTNYNETYK